jgi:hypothetical protein
MLLWVSVTSWRRESIDLSSVVFVCLYISVLSRVLWSQVTSSVNIRKKTTICSKTSRLFARIKTLTRNWQVSRTCVTSDCAVSRNRVPRDMNSIKSRFVKNICVINILWNLNNVLLPKLFYLFNVSSVLTNILETRTKVNFQAEWELWLKYFIVVTTFKVSVVQ